MSLNLKCICASKELTEQHRKDIWDVFDYLDTERRLFPYPISIRLYEKYGYRNIVHMTCHFEMTGYNYAYSVWKFDNNEYSIYLELKPK